jgi:hypothetical protein
LRLDATVREIKTLMKAAPRELGPKNFLDISLYIRAKARQYAKSVSTRVTGHFLSG